MTGVSRRPARRLMDSRRKRTADWRSRWRWRRREGEGVGTISVAETKELPNGVSVEGEGKGETWASGLCDERNDGPIYLGGGGLLRSQELNLMCLLSDSCKTNREL